MVLPYLYFWIFDKCDYAYALNRLLDYFSKLRNVILLLTSINCRKSTMINNVTNRVDFVLFKGIITLFFFSTLTLNVVFQQFFSFGSVFWYFCRTYFGFLSTGLTSGSRFWRQKLNMFQCFHSFFFLWQHFLLFIFREDSFPVPSEMSHFRFWFKRQNFEFVAVDISVLTGFFFGSFLL